MKEIKGVGFRMPSNGDDYFRLDSLNSLSECDIVIFDTSFSQVNYSYSYSQSYNGKPCYNHDYSTKISEHSEHWKKEIIAYLKLGNTLFINLSENKSFYIQSGEKTFSGTGRNRKTINLVKQFSNYDFFPNFDRLQFNVAHGKKIIYVNPIFANFFKEFEPYMSYETYITSNDGYIKGFTTKSRDKVLGGIIEAYGGHVVFFPKINFSLDEFYNKIGDFTEDAKIKGLRFKQLLIEIDNSIKKNNTKTPKPSWLENESYKLKKSEEIIKKIETQKNKIKKIESGIEKLEEDLNESDKLNDLLFETGTPLENAVTYALTILGFKAENYDDGILELDQVIVSPEGIRYIGECEGKDNKQIDITKFRQLSDALNEDFTREEVEEKAFGLLFGNPFRFTPPHERTDPFTNKCIGGAKREKIGLIETSELYRIAKYLSENEDEDLKKKCREIIFNNLGEVISFPAL